MKNKLSSCEKVSSRVAIVFNKIWCFCFYPTEFPMFFPFLFSVHYLAANTHNDSQMLFCSLRWKNKQQARSLRNMHYTFLEDKKQLKNHIKCTRQKNYERKTCIYFWREQSTRMFEWVYSIFGRRTKLNLLNVFPQNLYENLPKSLGRNGVHNLFTEVFKFYKISEIFE